MRDKDKFWILKWKWERDMSPLSRMWNFLDSTFFLKFSQPHNGGDRKFEWSWISLFTLFLGGLVWCFSSFVYQNLGFLLWLLLIGDLLNNWCCFNHAEIKDIQQMIFRRYFHKHIEWIIDIFPHWIHIWH